MLVFTFINNDPEAPTRRMEALCWLAQGGKNKQAKKPQEDYLYFFAISFDTRNNW